MNIDHNYAACPKSKIGIDDIVVKTEGNVTQMNPFKNPYRITFFNQSLAKKYFEGNNIMTKLSSKNTIRTSKAILSSGSKKLNRREFPQSKTPELCSMNKIHATMTDQRKRDCIKSNRMNLESKSESQKKAKLNFCPRVIVQPEIQPQTTRNNVTKNNSITKENTITGIKITAISKKKMINLKETNNNINQMKHNHNTNIVNANLLSEDIRMKMITFKNSRITNKTIEHDYRIANESKLRDKTTEKMIKAKAIHHCPTEHTIKNNKLKPAAEFIVKNNNSNSIHCQSMLKCNLKNQYNELINLYLLSEEV